MGAIQGGTGALFGGIAGGIRARSYGCDLWTGKRNVSFSTGRMAFNGNMQIATPELESSLTEINNYETNIVEIHRTWETEQSTISTFNTTDGQTGYFLEPNGPSSVVDGSGLRIQEGIYILTEHSGTNFQDVYRLQNVPGRSNILMHPGNTADDTVGCLLPGLRLNAAMELLRTFINDNGGARNIFVIIF